MSRYLKVNTWNVLALWNQVSRDLRPKNFRFSYVLWNQVSRDLRIITWNILELWNQVSRDLRVKFYIICWAFKIKWAEISDPITLDFLCNFKSSEQRLQDYNLKYLSPLKSSEQGSHSEIWHYLVTQIPFTFASEVLRSEQIWSMHCGPIY